MAHKSSSKRLWWIITTIVVLLAGGLFWAKKAGKIGQKKPIEVIFAKVQKGEIIEKVTTSGKIQPETEVKISPDVSGEIIELTIEEGDSVVKGQLLARIRPDNYESQLARAKATVNSSRASLEQSRAAVAQTEARLIRASSDFVRQKKLFEDKVISQADYDNADANYKIAKQELESGKANIEAAKYNIQSAEAALKDAAETLRKTSLFAPQNGTISKLNVELGERVAGNSFSLGTEMMRIANLNKMEVRVNVSENDIVRVSLGDTAIIDVDAYSNTGRKFKGVVYEIASTANGTGLAVATSSDAVTEFQVKIKILRSSYRDLIGKNNKFPMRPGMTASIEIITERKGGILTVPLAAVTTRGGDKKDESPVLSEEEAKKQEEQARTAPKVQPKEVIFVNAKGKAKMREVKTGISDFDTIEIISGLVAGDEIVAGPYNVVSKKLSDGDAIMKLDETKNKTDEGKKN